MVKHVYFDESGFTGNNLLSKDQPYFSYAAVVTDENESRQIVEHIIEKYSIAAGELKGSTLVNSRKLQPAVDEILSHFKGRMRAVVNEKKYALSGKFFEYIFEPVLASKSTIFYDLKFHLFISNIMFFSLVAKDEYAELLHSRFENFSRGKIQVNQFIEPIANCKYSEIMSDIYDFAKYNISIIEEEYSGLEGTGVDKWVLDLTSTSLYNLLCDVSSKIGAVKVTCDSSKPLITHQDMFNNMIGNEKIIYETFNNKKIPITFNLAEPISLSDSKVTHGIQIADVIAAASIYVLNKKNQKDKYFSKWQDLFEKEIYYWQCCVVPTPENLDPKNHNSYLNKYILQEIANRSRKSIPVLENIEKDILRISRTLAIMR
ncbi:DUF3800 domain-containing protein [Escherichia coli]|uniref:DUF3800 domain-containing protein n=1 Tax=Escherichia coli TaxID=562 RepID=UPI001302A5D3|nr:DUF3800 domain-containing protein [Escherichia coli]KAE9653652.1 DUF3800 domain-containing protein [Escherichia coli]MWK71058.1 DUF3800 domain-containing protein [Escherichia coli]